MGLVEGLEPPPNVALSLAEGPAFLSRTEANHSALVPRWPRVQRGWLSAGENWWASLFLGQSVRSFKVISRAKSREVMACSMAALASKWALLAGRAERAAGFARRVEARGALRVDFLAMGGAP